MTIDPRRGVVATVPGVRTGESAARALVEPFLAEREAWIRRHLDRQEAVAQRVAAAGEVRDGSLLRYRGESHRVRVADRPPGRRRSHVERIGADDEDVLLVTLAAAERRPLAAVLEAWLRVRARDAVEAAIARHAGPLGVTPTSIAVRDTRTRWGSASRRGRVMLAWRLVLAPPEVLETVVVHELCHLRVFGHGPQFWAWWRRASRTTSSTAAGSARTLRSSTPRWRCVRAPEHSGSGRWDRSMGDSEGRSWHAGPRHALWTRGAALPFPGRFPSGGQVR